MIPSTAQRLSVNRRVVNLRDMPDPADISADTSNVSSFDTSMKENTPVPEVPLRQITPEASEESTTQWYPSVDGNGKKGILRPIGTPGSGNGVRFFPKNRFRVITPNQSITTPQKAPPSPSFLSQLLSVSFPIISSPRPSPSTSVVHPDESWEVPGQEGEVSLLSAASFQSEASLMMVEEESWHGEPQVICSPLALPAEAPSKEVSYQDLELPSADWGTPDLSNLLSTRMSPPPGNSFSMDMKSEGSLARGTEGSWNDSSEISVVDHREEDNPTIRLPMINHSPMASPTPSTPAPGRAHLAPSSTPSMIREITSTPFLGPNSSPIDSPPPKMETTTPDESTSFLRPPSSSPLPKSPSSLLSPSSQSPSSPLTPSSPAQPRSIFADMSAEQANFVWPVSRHSSDIGTETIFHSLGDISISPGTSRPSGEKTQYFDFSSDGISLSSPLSSIPAVSLSSRPSLPTSNSTTTLQTLVQPSQTLFEAQNSHTSALQNELHLYRELSTKLQGEVAERDGVLADLRIRLLDADMLRSQVSQLERELVNRATTKRAEMETPSPSPLDRRNSRMEHVGDRTTGSHAEIRDLEIRLQKSMGDVEVYANSLHEAQETTREAHEEVQRLKDEMRSLKDAQKDVEVREERTAGDLKSKKEDLEAKSQLLEGEVQILKRQLEGREGENAKADLDEETIRLRTDLEELEQAHETELRELKSERDERLREVEEERDEALERGLQMAFQIETLESSPPAATSNVDVEALQIRIEEMEKEMNNLLEVKRDDDEEILRLKGVVRSMDGGGREEKLRERLADLEREVKEERLIRLEAEATIDDLFKIKGVNEQLRHEIQSLQEQMRATQRREAQKHETQLRQLEDENQTLRDSLQTANVSGTPASSSITSDNTAQIQKLQAEINRLRSESSLKDLEIITLQKRKTELKEDREMLNVALDSKQQEVELMKRKFQVRGTAGSTPLASSSKQNVPQTAIRRYSHASQAASGTPMTKSLATPAPYRGSAFSSTMSNRVYGYDTPANVLGSVREKGKKAAEVARGGEARVEMLVSSVEPRRSRRRETMLA